AITPRAFTTNPSKRTVATAVSPGRLSIRTSSAAGGFWAPATGTADSVMCSPESSVCTTRYPVVPPAANWVTLSTVRPSMITGGLRARLGADAGLTTAGLGVPESDAATGFGAAESGLAVDARVVVMAGFLEVSGLAAATALS